MVMSGAHLRFVFWLILALEPTVLGAQNTVRRPLGVYVKVDVETAIAGYPGSGTPTSAQLHSYFQSLLASLVNNPAISGITIGQRWDNIQPNSATAYDWSYIDDAFNAAAAVTPVGLLAVALLASPRRTLVEADLLRQLSLLKALLADCPYSKRVTVTALTPQQIIAYGEEGESNPGTNVSIADNTIVNDLASGSAVVVGAQGAANQAERPTSTYALEPPGTGRLSYPLRPGREPTSSATRSRFQRP